MEGVSGCWLLRAEWGKKAGVLNIKSVNFYLTPLFTVVLLPLTVLGVPQSKDSVLPSPESSAGVRVGAISHIYNIGKGI